MPPRILCCAALMLITVSASATPPFKEYATYSIVGFSADGGHAYFKKEQLKDMCYEEWIAVYSVKTRRLVQSVPIARSSYDGSGGDCDRGRAVSDAYGKLTIKKLHKKYGAPVKPLKLKPRTKRSRLVFEGSGIGVQLKIKGSFPELACDDKDLRLRARIRVQLVATVDGKTHVLRQRRRTLRPVFAADYSAECGTEWPPVNLSNVVVSPKRRALALILHTKPAVLTLPAQKSPPKRSK